VALLASRLMHYIIANEILKVKAIDRNLFILGNLAPDAQDGTATGKLASHFRRRIGNDYDVYPNIDLDSFREKYVNNNIDAFILGYYCHLISDSVWVKLIYPNYLQFTIDKEKDKKQREILFSDLSILNEILSKHYNLEYENTIVIPQKLGITECLYDGLDELLHSLYEDFNKRHKDKELRIFNLDFILEYILAAVNQCNKELELFNL
jgi:hypothetical protein